MKNLIIILFFYLICSCSSQNQCSQFEYKKVGLDTIEFKKTQIFINKNDTIRFINKSTTIYAMKTSNPSFTHLDECKNGCTFEYSCEKHNLTYYIGFNKVNSDYQYDIWSYCIDKQYERYSNVKDINLTASFKKEYEKRKSTIQRFVVKNGKLIQFVDDMGREWTRFFET